MAPVTLKTSAARCLISIAGVDVAEMMFVLELGPSVALNFRGIRPKRTVILFHGPFGVSHGIDRSFAIISSSDNRIRFRFLPRSLVSAQLLPVAFIQRTADRVELRSPC